VKSIRLGMIGCGNIAASAHLPAVAMLPGMVQLVAVADVRESAAQEAAAPFGADFYTDYRRILERKDIDMVVVTTPEFLHREQVVAAAEAGKHILCEKPMASSMADADAMILACERAGVRLMVGHSRRFTTKYQEIRRLVDSGAIGDVRIIRENERRSRPPLGQSGSYWNPNHWTGDPKVSVGVALTNAIHETDLFGWFAGSEPVRVFAEHKSTRAGGLVPDFISITATFANGVQASAEVNNFLPPGHPAYHQFEIYGTKGAIRAKDHDQQSLVRFRDQGADFPHTYESLLHFQDAYALELSQFVTALHQDLPVPLPASEARAALRLALTAVESAKTGKAIEMGPVAEGGRLV
jgi:predicted dehydrogenase